MMPLGWLSNVGAWVHGIRYGDWPMRYRMGPSWRRRRATAGSPRDRNPGPLLRQYPDAREQRPPPNVEIAIEGIVALAARPAGRFRRRHARHAATSRLQLTGLRSSRGPFRAARPAPTAKSQPSSAPRGRSHSVAQAISRNPFIIIVPCHRVLEAGSYADKISPNGGAISKRRLLSIEGALGRHGSKTLFDVLLSALPRPARRAKIAA